MAQYEVKTPRGKYVIDSDDIQNDILKKEKISYDEVINEGKFVLLAQRDKKWYSTKMGKSNQIVGLKGCLITALSSMSSWYGLYRDPNYMAKNLNYLVGGKNDGSLLWQSINDANLPFKFVFRYYGRNDAKMKEILYSKDNAAVVEVNLGNAKHWVSLIGFDDRKGFKIADPWYNDYAYINDRYGKYTGFAEITRK